MSAANLQAVLERLERDDPLGLRADGTSARWRARRLETRRFSNIFLLQPAGDGAALRARAASDALVLKLYGGGQAARRQKEHEDLVRVFGALGAAGGVVRPVACYPELGALVTARASGAPLVSLVRAACRRKAHLALLARAAALCASAGGWLRTFQAAGAASCSGERPQHLGDPAGFLEYLDARLRILRELRPGIEPALRTRLLARAAATLHALPPDSLGPVTWSHADFGPHNLLADGERLTVLDFELSPEHPYFDAAYFVEALSHVRGPFVDATRVRRLERAFLSGYGAALDEPLFALFRLRHLVCSYVSEGRRGRLERLRVWAGLRDMRARLRRFPALLPLRARAA